MSSLKGCFHDGRPKNKVCTNCGSSLCYECYIEEELGGRITAYTSIDAEVRKEFGYFCPSCYIARISESNYRLPIGLSSSAQLQTQNPNKPPNILNPFSHSDSKIYPLILIGLMAFGLILTILYEFLFVVSLIAISIGLVLWFIGYNLSKKSFNDFIEKKQKALDLLNQHSRKGKESK